MAGSGVTLYFTTSAGNKAVIGTIDWREAIYMPSQVNDNVAQIMADIRAMANAVATGWIEIGDGDGTYTATYVAADSFRFDGVNVTAYYRVGMRVRVVAPTPGTLSGTITSSTFSTHTTLVVTWDSGSLSNEAITSVSLGIGSDATATALASTPTSYRNILGRNGGLEVWQRHNAGAVSLVVPAASSAYAADGWYIAGSPSKTVTQTSGTTAGSRWSARVTRSAGSADTGPVAFEFPLESEEIKPLNGSIVTLSFTIQKEPNFSAASSALTVMLPTGTGAPAKITTTGYTAQTNVISSSITLTSTATRVSLTSSVIVPTNTTQATVYFQFVPTGTAGALDGFVIDDVQLEIGRVATPFERRPFESELLACMRHYTKTFNYTTAPAQNAGVNTGDFQFMTVQAGANAFWAYFTYPVLMRKAPIVTTYNPSAANNQIRNAITSTDCTSTSTVGTERGVQLGATSPGGTTAGNVHAVHLAADAGI